MIIVLENSSGGRVVDGVGSGRVDSGGHVVARVQVEWLISSQQDVNGLARGYGYIVGEEWLGVASV